MLLVRDKRPQLEAILTQCDGQEEDDDEEEKVRGGKSRDGSRNGTENGPAKSKKSGKSSGKDATAITTNKTEGAMLLQLVDQLATLAAAAENNQKLYHQTESEPVHINWAELSRRLGSTGKTNSSRTFSTNNAFNDPSRTDSSADVDMATVSELHSITKK